MLEKLGNLLQGKKAYIIMILGFIFNVGVLAGFWPVDSQM